MSNGCYQKIRARVFDRVGTSGSKSCNAHGTSLACRRPSGNRARDKPARDARGSNLLIAAYRTPDHHDERRRRSPPASPPAPRAHGAQVCRHELSRPARCVARLASPSAPRVVRVTASGASVSETPAGRVPAPIRTTRAAPPNLTRDPIPQMPSPAGHRRGQGFQAGAPSLPLDPPNPPDFFPPLVARCPRHSARQRAHPCSRRAFRAMPPPQGRPGD